jgi:hypothetical protein
LEDETMQEMQCIRNAYVRSGDAVSILTMGRNNGTGMLQQWLAEAGFNKIIGILGWRRDDPPSN